MKPLGQAEQCVSTQQISESVNATVLFGGTVKLSTIKFVKTKKIKLKHEMAILTHKYEVPLQITCYSRKKLTRFIFPKFKNVSKNYRTSISSSAAACKIWFCNFAFTLQKKKKKILHRNSYFLLHPRTVGRHAVKPLHTCSVQVARETVTHVRRK